MKGLNVVILRITFDGFNKCRRNSSVNKVFFCLIKIH